MDQGDRDVAADDQGIVSSTEAFEQAARAAAAEHYVLRLYVAGMTAKSTRAVENIRQVCEQHLQGRYELEVIDVYKNPLQAGKEQIVALPTLLKQLPLPLRRIIGDLSNSEKLIVGLDLRPRPDSTPE
jgi:circadian clock protein KaiB